MDKKLYIGQLERLSKNEKVMQMKKYRMHRKPFFRKQKPSTVYNHVFHVAFVAMNIADRLNMEVDELALANGCVLHDYYLYDYNKQGIKRYLHGNRHPYIAFKNAYRDFPIGQKEQTMILSHMFPIFMYPVMNKESLILSVADKYCAIVEKLGRE